MKSPKQHLDLLEHEYNYFDHLVSITRRPYNIGVLKNINKRIKILNAFIKSETDTEALERARLLLDGFKTLRQRHYHIHKKRKK